MQYIYINISITNIDGISTDRLKPNYGQEMIKMNYWLKISEKNWLRVIAKEWIKMIKIKISRTLEGGLPNSVLLTKKKLGIVNANLSVYALPSKSVIFHFFEFLWLIIITFVMYARCHNHQQKIRHGPIQQTILVLDCVQQKLKS